MVQLQRGVAEDGEQSFYRHLGVVLVVVQRDHRGRVQQLLEVQQLFVLFGQLVYARRAGQVAAQGGGQAQLLCAVGRVLLDVAVALVVLFGGQVQEHALLVEEVAQYNQVLVVVVELAGQRVLGNVDRRLPHLFGDLELRFELVGDHGVVREPLLPRGVGLQPVDYLLLLERIDRAECSEQPQAADSHLLVVLPLH